MKYIYPTFVLLISIVFIVLEGNFFEMQTSKDYFGFAAYGAISMIMMVALFAIQKMINIREVYLYLVAGFTFIYVSLLLCTLDKIYIYPSNVTDVMEDLFRLVGFGFVTVGIIKWIKYDEGVKHKLIELASMDALTNIMNRRVFDIEFRREFINAKRYDRSLSLISIDLDFFKEVNDQHGHFFGDLVLKVFTAEVSSLLRAGDIFSRWGGDEFCILLPQTNTDNAMKVAEKIRAVVKNISVKTDKSDVHFTVSLGVSGYLPEDEDASEILERADKALYEAKESGRDRTVLGIERID
ncbi:MAG: GGDEF domain-containing protein [Campylobacterota bacterium]|nr:GGDEF domain-containing protein [Campylobacterota bacterium]